MSIPMLASPRLHAVTCSSPVGLHRMAYYEWGDPENRDIILCVHGLTRTGRDFDALALSLSSKYRVICPDIVGRGLSDRLNDPLLYGVPQYLSDMVTLIAQLQPDRLQWVGTSLGGLIGLAYAGALAQASASQVLATPAQVQQPLPETDLRLDRIVLNDVGPHLEPAALDRIGQYVGDAMRFNSFEQAVDYVKLTAASFGPHTQEQWQHLTRYTYIQHGAHWVKHYDLGLAVAFNARGDAITAQGEQYLWQAYSSIFVPILIVRGQDSDLLSTATLEQMLAANSHARAIEFAGVGHAPTFMSVDQIVAVKEFLNANPT